ncbi:hypothetical protein PCE1_003831 [Barthelona sp. PCE]
MKIEDANQMEVGELLILLKHAIGELYNCLILDESIVSEAYEPYESDNQIQQAVNSYVCSVLNDTGNNKFLIGEVCDRIDDSVVTLLHMDLDEPSDMLLTELISEIVSSVLKYRVSANVKRTELLIGKDDLSSYPSEITHLLTGNIMESTEENNDREKQYSIVSILQTNLFLGLEQSREIDKLRYILMQRTRQ